MTDQPAAIVTRTYHDTSSGPIVGVHYDVRCGGLEAEVTLFDAVPVSEDIAKARYTDVLGQIGAALVIISKNPQLLHWGGQVEELMPTNVLFRGPGPFSIAAAQSASAKALSSTVEMTLNAIVGSVRAPRPVAIEMTHGVANKLGHDLVARAVGVETRRP
jgi:hypothetical protein